MIKSLTETDLIQLRLHNQQISKTKFTQSTEIVRWLCAIQGQDYYGAKWSIGLRIPGITDEKIEKAILDKKIIRTWPMRGTLHFVAAEDVKWILSLVAPRIISANKTRDKQLGLNSKKYSQINDILVRTLEGGKELTREELTEELKLKGINVDGVKLSHILQRAGLEKIVCFGTRRGKKFTYTLLDDWVPDSKKIDYDEALSQLAGRYFKSRGPATIQDFIWWSGLNAADARKGLEIIKQKLIQKSFNGKIYFLNKTALHSSSSKVYLLPGFDEYLIGYKDRSEIIKSEMYKVINAGGGILSQTIIINGKVAGTWKREFVKGKLVIYAKPLYSFTKEDKIEISRAANRFSKFQNMEFEMKWIDFLFDTIFI